MLHTPIAAADDADSLGIDQPLRSPDIERHRIDRFASCGPILRSRQQEAGIHQRAAIVRLQHGVTFRRQRLSPPIEIPGIHERRSTVRKDDQRQPDRRPAARQREIARYEQAVGSRVADGAHLGDRLQVLIDLSQNDCPVGVPIEYSVHVPILGAEHTHEDPRVIIGRRQQVNPLVRERAQHRVPVRLQLVVEKDVVSPIDVPETADDAPALALQDFPREPLAPHRRRAPTFRP